MRLHSKHVLAAIHIDGLAGHKIRIRRCEEEDRADKILARVDGDDDSLLTTEAIAELWQISEKWFVLGRTMGYGPEFVIIEPHAVRYPRDKAKAWLRKRLHQKTPGWRKLEEA